MKLDGKIVNEVPNGYTAELIKLGNLSLSMIYDNSKNEEELLNNLKKEQTRLMQSIERREKLLSNENYLKKAPSNIVETEKESLKKEKEQLELITQKLS